jgi:hypothetical protein
LLKHWLIGQFEARREELEAIGQEIQAIAARPRDTSGTGKAADAGRNALA